MQGLQNTNIRVKDFDDIMLADNTICLSLFHP